MKNEEHIKWQEIDRKNLFSTAVFDLIETTSLSPRGKEAHFNVLQARDWAIVIPHIKSDREDIFLMVRQWRHGSKCVCVEFPGGVIEKDELPEEGAKRELLEETGYSCDKLDLLATLSPNPAIMDNRVYIFYAQNPFSAKKQELDSNEFLDLLKIPTKEVIKNNGQAPYTHGLMTAALGLWLTKIDK